MDTFKRLIAASGSLAFLIAVITSGCGGGGGNAAANTLLSDDFSGPLAAKWTITHSFSPDTSFHRFVFSIDASGNAKWSRDGALPQVVAGFPLNKNVSLQATSPGSTDTVLGSAHMDNVLVTTP